MISVQLDRKKKKILNHCFFVRAYGLRLTRFTTFHWISFLHPSLFSISPFTSSQAIIYFQERCIYTYSLFLVPLNRRLHVTKLGFATLYPVAQYWSGSKGGAACCCVSKRRMSLSWDWNVTLLMEIYQNVKLKHIWFSSNEPNPLCTKSKFRWYKRFLSYWSKQYFNCFDL